MGTLRKIKRNKGLVFQAEIFLEEKRMSKTFQDEIGTRIWMGDNEKAIREGVKIDGSQCVFSVSLP